jgi:6-pyruvoyltetrahydropterin/6-carboxytetrahydropterin synthase
MISQGASKLSWKIHIERGNLSFSAAHFITLERTYEPLHGHNYDISATLNGSALTHDSYVLDFGVVKAMLRNLIKEVDHRFLLPLHNPFMTISREGNSWEIVLTDGERFVIPSASVVAMPIDNITAERLAEYFAHKLGTLLHERGVTNITAITVGIAETEMQAAFYTLDLAR